ncbi:MAG: hypothetical protein ACK2UK_01760 [Candidatus Promineifilaceae bacterium]
MIDSKLFAGAVLITVIIVSGALFSLSGGSPSMSIAAPAAAAGAALASAAEPVVPERVDPGGAVIANGDHLPLMIRWSNWRPEFGPSYVYAREADLDGMLNLDAPVEKMIMTASYEEVERLMRFADELKASGVTTVGLNTENGAGMTPGAEMQTLDSVDPEVNIVARVARLASDHGFKVVWGPVRAVTDQVSERTILAMMEAGLDGLAIQEQKFIETQSAGARLAAVERTRSRYLALAQRAGIEDFSFHVQIMQERCPDLQNCVEFVEGLEAIPVDSIAIWSNGPIPVDFVNAIRMQDTASDLIPNRQ